MASSLCAVFLRLCHFILHILAVILICIGLITFPATTSTSAKPRAIVWIVFESVYVLISLNVLVYSLCVALNKVPRLYEGIQERLLKDSRDVSLSYYLLMTLFVLYGTMFGCHIPGLFYDKKSKFLILAVGTGGLNAVLYFLAAFVPLDVDFSDSDQVHRPSADTTIDSEDCGNCDCDDTKSCHSTNNPVMVEVADDDDKEQVEGGIRKRSGAKEVEEEKKRNSTKEAEEQARRASQESK